MGFLTFGFTGIIILLAWGVRIFIIVLLIKALMKYLNDKKATPEQEIIRRYYTALCEAKENMTSSDTVNKLDLLMKQAKISATDRPVIAAALEKEEMTDGPAAAIQLHDGKILTGKTSPLLGAPAALLLNALKAFANIDDSVELISPTVIEPVQMPPLELERPAEISDALNEMV